ncbi:MAG TPA: hypothetical protein VFU81_19530 [Thermomicrobiales bacterium]|nr:hypothetical protein [Thermomicrobiales bacterium]
MTESDSTQPRPRGHVEATPEARPLPPAWRDHFQGPIPGMPAGPAPASAANQSAGQPGSASSASQGAANAANQPAPAAQPVQPGAGQAAASAPLEPHPAFQPDVNRPIPLYGDRQERSGGEERQRGAGWDAGDLLKPLAAGAALLAIAGVRLAARGVAQLADALANRRRP